MSCPNCNTSTKLIDKTIAYYHICEKCYHRSVSYPENTCCFSPTNEPVRLYDDIVEAMQDTDKYVVYNQCQSCGRKNGTALKKANFNKSELKHFDEDLVEQTQKLRIEVREYAQEIEKQKIEDRRDTFWNDYNEYLKSEEWQIKRELVLKRDNNLCQSCLSETAMEVHHTVGIFRKNEPLFSLVALCGKCHNIITEIERGNHKNAKKNNT
jgi:5-methylcytosine-specific restriction endonuclease McrA